MILKITVLREDPLSETYPDAYITEVLDWELQNYQYDEMYGGYWLKRLDLDQLSGAMTKMIAESILPTDYKVKKIARKRIPVYREELKARLAKTDEKQIDDIDRYNLVRW